MCCPQSSRSYRVSQEHNSCSQSASSQRGTGCLLVTEATLLSSVWDHQETKTSNASVQLAGDTHCGLPRIVDKHNIYAGRRPSSFGAVEALWTQLLKKLGAKRANIWFQFINPVSRESLLETRRRRECAAYRSALRDYSGAKRERERSRLLMCSAGFKQE